MILTSYSFANIMFHKTSHVYSCIVSLNAHSKVSEVEKPGVENLEGAGVFRVPSGPIFQRASACRRHLRPGASQHHPCLSWGGDLG